ncbi:hypothetical protein EJ07DRAFT_159383 [Lizonia empirigonia]|nr:hypothetical protein EJ07DRAFT_159383 [Lizonia empirigonia]
MLNFSRLLHLSQQLRKLHKHSTSFAGSIPDIPGAQCPFGKAERCNKFRLPPTELMQHRHVPGARCAPSTSCSTEFLTPQHPRKPSQRGLAFVVARELVTAVFYSTAILAPRRRRAGRESQRPQLVLRSPLSTAVVAPRAENTRAVRRSPRFPELSRLARVLRAKLEPRPATNVDLLTPADESCSRDWMEIALCTHHSTSGRLERQVDRRSQVAVALREPVWSAPYSLAGRSRRSRFAQCVERFVRRKWGCIISTWRPALHQNVQTTEVFGTNDAVKEATFDDLLYMLGCRQNSVRQRGMPPNECGAVDEQNEPPGTQTEAAQRQESESRHKDPVNQLQRWLAAQYLPSTMSGTILDNAADYSSSNNNNNNNNQNDHTPAYYGDLLSQLPFPLSAGASVPQNGAERNFPIVDGAPTGPQDKPPTSAFPVGDFENLVRLLVVTQEQREIRAKREEQVASQLSQNTARLVELVAEFQRVLATVYPAALQNDKKRPAPNNHQGRPGPSLNIERLLERFAN